jgi:CRISPR-associated protein Cas2
MFVILVYDIADRQFKERDNSRRIRKTIEKFLPRVQFSVYEGEMRESDFKKMTGMLEKHADHNQDSIIIYRFDSLKYNKRLVIGIEKNDNLFS